MNATNLRTFLLSGLVLLLAGAMSGGWWLQDALATQVVRTDHAQADATASQLDLERLRLLKVRLLNQKDIVDRAAQIASTAVNYKFQDQVVGDLEAYANRHGITIAGFDFSTSVSVKGKTSLPNGAQRTQFNVALLGAIKFDTFMSFLRDVENNLTKLQVVSLTLAPSREDPNAVNQPTLTLVVYLKK